jgi:predicted dehydrogenase
MITTALIGYGRWGPNVARNIMKNNRLNLYAICEIKQNRLDDARSIYLDKTRYETDYRKILANPDIQAVAIAVETEKHHIVAREALEAGKHVYIEKPFTASVEDAIALTRLARERNRIIHVDHIMVFHPAIQRLKKLMDAGELGDLLYIEAMRMNLGQIKKDVSVMWDLAVHDLSIIDYLSGGHEPYYIHAVGDKKFSNTETLTFLTLRFDGFIAHIRSSWISPVKDRRLIVAGTRRMVVFDETKPSENLVVYDKGVDVVSGTDADKDDYKVKVRSGDTWIPDIPLEDALYNSINHFASMILDGVAPISSADQAIRVQKILEKADETMNVN